MSERAPDQLPPSSGGHCYVKAGVAAAVSVDNFVAVQAAANYEAAIAKLHAMAGAIHGTEPTVGPGPIATVLARAREIESGGYYTPLRSLEMATREYIKGLQARLWELETVVRPRP